MRTILAIHQGAEKYGSDKSFVAACAALDRDPAKAVNILLPEKGPIFELIAAAELPPADTRHLWILRKADIVKAVTVGLPRNLLALLRAMRDLRRADIVYVNTAVILDFLLAAIITRRRMIVHVREIPVGIAMKVIRNLLILARADVIFNSQATADAFALPATQRQAVVYNGFQQPDAFEKTPYDAKRPLDVLCIGRLNAWKGQEVLVKACAQLSPAQRSRLSVKIVGGVYKDQTHFRTDLEQLIAEHDLADTIEMQSFVDDPTALYQGADVVVVPSTLPEPFGRVAIEGMAYGNAIIATDHGGLKEIVVQDETGQLITPGDPGALAQALADYLEDAEKLARHQQAGQDRFLSTFTQEACDLSLHRAFDGV